MEAKWRSFWQPLAQPREDLDANQQILKHRDNFYRGSESLSDRQQQKNIKPYSCIICKHNFMPRVRMSKVIHDEQICLGIHDIESNKTRAPKKGRNNSCLEVQNIDFTTNKKCTVKNKFVPRSQKDRLHTEEHCKKNLPQGLLHRLHPHESTHYKGRTIVPRCPRDRLHQKESTARKYASRASNNDFTRKRAPIRRETKRNKEQKRA